MSKQKNSRKRVHYIKLSPTEMDIMREEYDDQNGAKRNIPILRQMLLEERELTQFLFDPTVLPDIMARVTQYINSQKSLTTEAVNEEEYYKILLQSLLPYFKANLLLNKFTQLAKDRKIKREKRVLLWAVGDLMSVTSKKNNPQKSYVYQTLVNASLDYTVYLSELSSMIFEGKEPLQFNYEDYIGDSFPSDKFNILYQTFQSKIQDIHRYISLRAVGVFEIVKKPFGLPFYEILHLPEAIPKKKSSLIMSPEDETNNPASELTDDEIFHKLIHAMRRDSLMINGVDWANYAIQSIKNAAFGETEPDVLKEYFNGIVFSFLFPFLDNPLLITLYEQSGTNAGELIPDDERNDWIEITSSPENPQAYRNYGDTLLNKENWKGAYKAYLRAGELMEEMDTELNEKIESLKIRLKEQFKNIHQHDHDCEDHDCNDPTHHHA